MQQTAAYGTWDSRIAADLIATKGNSIEDLLVDPVTSEVYYIEERPLEGEAFPAFLVTKN